ncbi:MAG: RNB domain-containing ribonuclease [Rhodobacteraceae bacterium]|nr:RNB domain-containing ribonuclease [Paracoccaceae bacterium]
MNKLPSKKDILDWISDNPTLTAKRDIAKAFGIKGPDRIELKKILRELEADGHLSKRKNSFRDPNQLPPVSIVEVMAPTSDGDLLARPLEWDGDDVEPIILFMTRKSDPALGRGDRILAKLTKVSNEQYQYEGRLIRKIGISPTRVLGVFRQTSEGGRIVPIDKTGKEWTVSEQGRRGAKDGELVLAEQIGPKARMGLPKASVVERLGNPSAPKAVSLIAIHQHGIPDHFPDDVVAEADNQKPAPLGNRTTYFPDRVVPMLPDRLSGDLCSLHEGVPRASIVVRMQIDKDGQKLGHTFFRGLIKSHASLTYEQAQSAVDGAPNDKCLPLLETVIRPLYDAYHALVKARELRAPLDLELPERRVELSDEGKVISVNFKDRLDAHKLIEEFMILANVSAAEVLIEKKSPLLFRVHEEPSDDKLESLRETAKSAGLVLAKGQVLRTKHLNMLLRQARDTEHSELINMSTLRSMTQAYYSPENFGHFGLSLRSYAHFTSPIRRYADLIVHRGLISSHGWGDDGLTAFDIENLAETANKISETERRSMLAERDTTDRYLAAYLSEKMGSEFQGKISGIAKFGIFVRLDETGADGIIPIRSLGREYFDYDQTTNTLMGSETGITFSLGLRVMVRLTEAEPTAGGVAFELISINDEIYKRTGGRRGRGDRPKRMLVKSKRKAAKSKLKARRRRTGS